MARFHDMHDLHEVIITVATSAYVCFILVAVLIFSTIYNNILKLS